jgi:hypothetical protein
MRRCIRSAGKVGGSALGLIAFGFMTVTLASAPAHAALTMVYVRAQGGATTENRMIFDEHHIRMDGVPGGMGASPHGRGQGPGRAARAHSVILDASLRKMMVIDPDQRSYHEMTEADMRQMKARMDAMKAQMQERMKNMPPEQRKMMEQMMGGKAAGAMASGNAPVVRYEALGQKKTVAGHACEMYKVLVGDMMTSHTCFAPWSSGIVSKADVESFKALAAELKKMFDVTGMGGNQDWSKIPGVPVEETHFGLDGKTVEWTNTLKSTQRGSVPADTFTVPAGYKKEALPTGPAFGGGSGGPRGRRPTP